MCLCILKYVIKKHQLVLSLIPSSTGGGVGQAVRIAFLSFLRWERKSDVFIVFQNIHLFTLFSYIFGWSARLAGSTAPVLKSSAGQTCRLDWNHARIVFYTSDCWFVSLFPESVHGMLHCEVFSCSQFFSCRHKLGNGFLVTILVLLLFTSDPAAELMQTSF